jgi:hypothetical protein
VSSSLRRETLSQKTYKELENGKTECTRLLPQKLSGQQKGQIRNEELLKA